MISGISRNLHPVLHFFNCSSIIFITFILFLNQTHNLLLHFGPLCSSSSFFFILRNWKAILFSIIINPSKPQNWRLKVLIFIGFAVVGFRNLVVGMCKLEGFVLWVFVNWKALCFRSGLRCFNDEFGWFL